MKIQFKATKTMPMYHGTYHFKDGDIRDVPDGEAQRLTSTFPVNFLFVIEDKSERMSEPKDDESYKPNKNRIGRPKKNRGL